ncbi:MAG: ABC transporter ATP-binding protein, partial [Beijerinckiaceae bacterium]
CVIRQARDGRAMVDVFGVEAGVRCAPGQAAGGAGELAVHASDFTIARRSEEGIAAKLKRLVYLGGRFRGEAVLAAAPELPITLEFPEPSTVAEGEDIHLAVRDGWVLPS